MHTDLDKTFPYWDPDLTLDKRVSDLISRFTLEEKIELIPQYQAAIERLGVKPYKHGTEAAHGIAWLGESTNYPQPIGLACTWDKDLLQRIGSAIGDEARGFYERNPEHNGLTLWAPTVDMERDPRWGRTEEAYGEDPVLAGKLAASLVKGMQGDHPFYLKSVATLKHFIGNNNEVDRGVASISLDPRNLREYYLKAFEIPFKEGGAMSMMTAYNAINGVPANLSPLVNDVVKREWGMDGFVVSDAFDVTGTMSDHHYVDTVKEAVARSIREGGIDSITDEANVVTEAIRLALQDGLLTENDLDMALQNTFRVRFRANSILRNEIRMPQWESRLFCNPRMRNWHVKPRKKLLCCSKTIKRLCRFKPIKLAKLPLSVHLLIPFIAIGTAVQFHTQSVRCKALKTALTQKETRQRFISPAARTASDLSQRGARNMYGVSVMRRKRSKLPKLKGKKRMFLKRPIGDGEATLYGLKEMVGN